MYHAILGKSKFDSLCVRLTEIKEDTPDNIFEGYDHPVYVDVGGRNQEEYEGYISSSKKKADILLQSLRTKGLTFFKREFVLLDKQNWRSYSQAKDFVSDYSRRGLTFIEWSFNLSKVFRLNEDHIHCVH